MHATRGAEPETRRLTVAILAAGLLVALLAGVFLANWWTRFNRALVDRDAALVGSLLAVDPDAGQRIAQALGRNPTAEETAAGREAARRYGYDEALGPRLNAVLTAPFQASIVAVIALCVLGTGAALGVSRSTLHGVMRRVQKVSAAAERITEGHPGIRLSDTGEGSLSLLNHRVNAMAERLLSALGQVQSEKDYLKDFLTDVSHQLKTPLASVRMFTDLVADGVERKNRDDFLARSQTQLDRMEWLIANLLAVARMEAGVVEFSVRPAPLEATVHEALAGVRALGERADVRLDWRLPTQSLIVPHDPRWVAEAVSNIVKNCIEHTPPNGTVSVRLESAAVLANIIVEDTGEGIAAEDIPHIFDRFFQPSLREGHASGTGIGLALARAIIERHHGMIAVASETGKGTRFTITLHTREI